MKKKSLKVMILAALMTMCCVTISGCNVNEAGDKIIEWINEDTSEEDNQN